MCFFMGRPMFPDKSFNEAREDLCRINEPQDNVKRF